MSGRHEGSERVAARLSVTRLQLGEHPSGVADALWCSSRAAKSTFLLPSVRDSFSGGL